MPKRRKGGKFYAVAIGRTPGIYSTWEECQSNVHGFAGARFKKFSSEEEAECFVASVSKTVRIHTNTNTPTSVTTSTTAAQMAQKRRKVIVAESLRERTVGSETNPITIQSPRAAVATGNSKNREPRSLAATANESDSIDLGDSGDVPSNKSDSEPRAANQCPDKLMFHVMFDGGSRGNPHGHAGAGAYILKRSSYDTKSKSAAKATETKVFRHTTRIRNYLGMGKLTNNMAEYMGLVNGLQQVLDSLEKTARCKQLKDVGILVQGDSDLIVKQMKGIYACKSPNLKSYHQQAKGLVQKIKDTSKTTGATVGITFEHVYREHNTIADGLANEAMDAQRSWTTSEGQESPPDETPPNTKDVRNENGDDPIEV